MWADIIRNHLNPQHLWNTLKQPFLREKGVRKRGMGICSFLQMTEANLSKFTMR